MIEPAASEILAAIDATWPPARCTEAGGWRLRVGEGGGKRVSAATAEAGDPDIAALAAAQCGLGQAPLAMLRPDETDLDARLAAEGYDRIDPVTVYLAPTATLTAPPPPVRAFLVSWPPLATQVEIWAAGGIGAGRLAVMNRVTAPKIALLGRSSDRPAGAGFAAAAGKIAMLHALEVAEPLRRTGTARYMVSAAAIWAEAQGADWFCALATESNAPSNALFRSLGLRAVTGYHYRSKRRPGGTDHG
ncbi:GNAT family N-acetyltransferase [Tropicimonas sp. IMCC34043]|uniref:GNAT family N-acetyltransferase n=1 Tax=Tropicimonas sp. IMCC34043 TaxID=2248760 RepID=UPI000E2878E7|nr:GNAT family N-acetyltransferase [Tropicimonas sp. IMCC34043]